MLEIFCGLLDEKIVVKDVKSFSNKGNLFCLWHLFFVVRQKDKLQTFYSFSSLLKSENPQYNTVGQWNDGMIVPPSDGPITVNSEAVACLG